MIEKKSRLEWQIEKCFHLQDRIIEQEIIIAELKVNLSDRESNADELEKVAESWMGDYQKLKDKYEPEIMATQKS